MDKQQKQLSPEEILVHAKKHPHSVNLSSEAFSVNKKDYVVYNISLKADPTNDFDVANYRRGLTFMEEIIDFKQQNLRVCKKGLRKFYDLIPEYLNIKQSHISNSKHFTSLRNKLFEPLKNDSEAYTIYSTQKANGENAQISWDESGGFWVIGSKNKTLLLSQPKDIKYITHKHEHVRTVSIAEEWFKFLDSQSDKTDIIKQKLNDYVLVGQICDSVKSGHIVDYGQQTKLYFYALVAKEERVYSCEPPSAFLDFSKLIGLQKYCVKFQTTTVNSFQALMEELKNQMYRVYQGDLQKYGEGVVVYVTSTHNGQQHCQTVCKVKTLQYRIYRKLRQKLKAYFQKYRKSYDKMLHKYIEEVKQLIKGFKTPKPEQYYFKIAQRAFQFCQDQQKAVSKFFHNKFIGFLQLIKNDNIDKQIFKKVMHEDLQNTQIKKLIQEKYLVHQQKQCVITVQEKQNKTNGIINKTGPKRVIVFLGMTIPACGKSTLYKKIKQSLKESNYHIQILSSDQTRAAKMQQLMKQKKMSKQKAFDKSSKAANQQYYQRLGQIMRVFEKDNESEKYILFMDKNHVENALNKTIEQIRNAQKKCKGLQVKIVGILPKCESLLVNKPKYVYPFSSCYIATCLKRVMAREEHQTLDGPEVHRANICIGFANLFRNFAVSNYNLSRYFDSVMMVPFTKERDVPQEITNQIITVMLGSKPGTFTEHSHLQILLQHLKKWEPASIVYEQQIPHIISELQNKFDNFNALKVDVSGYANSQPTKVQKNKSATQQKRQGSRFTQQKQEQQDEDQQKQ